MVVLHILVVTSYLSNISTPVKGIVQACIEHGVAGSTYSQYVNLQWIVVNSDAMLPNSPKKDDNRLSGQFS